MKSVQYFTHFVLTLKDDNLLVLGEYRASLHKCDIYWRIPGDPSEEIVHWAKLEMTDKVEVPDSDDNQETNHGTEISTGTGTFLLEHEVSAMQAPEKTNMHPQTAIGGDDQSPRPKRQKKTIVNAPKDLPGDNFQYFRPVSDGQHGHQIARGSVTSALKPLLAPPEEKRTCAVCCALMYPAIELKHAALEHLVCDVCACPAQKGSGHVLGSLASVVFFSHITFFAQLITIVSCLFHEHVNHVSIASKNPCRFVVMIWTNSVAGQKL